jgi:hypothetical protein
MHVGHFKRKTVKQQPHGYEVRHTRFWVFCCGFFPLFVNVALQLLDGCAISSLSLWHAMTLYDLTPFTFMTFAYLAWH